MSQEFTEDNEFQEAIEKAESLKGEGNDYYHDVLELTRIQDPAAKKILGRALERTRLQLQQEQEQVQEFLNERLKQNNEDEQGALNNMASESTQEDRYEVQNMYDNKRRAINEKIRAMVEIKNRTAQSVESQMDL